MLLIPSVDDLTSGRALIDALRPVFTEDLLGLDPVPPLPEHLGPGLLDAVVCVTGAGGLIGSELCRQILQLAPKALILLERSEPSLYAVEQELRQNLSSSVTLLPVLGSAADRALCSGFLQTTAYRPCFMPPPASMYPWRRPTRWRALRTMWAPAEWSARPPWQLALENWF